MGRGLDAIGKRFGEVERHVQRMREVVLGRLTAMHEEITEMDAKVHKIEEKLQKMSTTVTYGFEL